MGGGGKDLPPAVPADPSLLGKGGDRAGAASARTKGRGGPPCGPPDGTEDLARGGRWLRGIGSWHRRQRRVILEGMKKKEWEDRRQDETIE